MLLSDGGHEERSGGERRSERRRERGGEREEEREEKREEGRWRAADRVRWQRNQSECRHLGTDEMSNPDFVRPLRRSAAHLKR